MPIFDYVCFVCDKRHNNMIVTVEGRDRVPCPNGHTFMHRLPAAPMGRIAGRVIQGGGADRMVADSLGIRVDELPAGLRTPQEKHRL